MDPCPQRFIDPHDDDCHSAHASEAAPGGDRKASYLKCRHCRLEFSLNAPGTRHRNHCPHCLWSVHLDNTPGDRAAHCGGGMEPVAIAVDRDGEWHLVHQCGTCHTIHINRIAGDDDERALLALAIRPLSRLPFPI